VQREGCAAQKYPAQVTAMIDELERDWKLFPNPNDSMNARREALIAAQAASEGALATSIRTGLSSILGDLFVDWRSMDLDTEVTLSPSSPPTISPASTAMKFLRLTSLVWPGTAAEFSFTMWKGNENPLKTGDVLTLAPGLCGIQEVVTVTAVQYSWTDAGTFWATCSHVHEIGERATTAPWPAWSSNKRSGLVMITDLALMTPTLMARVNAFMRRIMPAVSTWCVCEVDPADADGNATDHDVVLAFAVGTQPIGWSPIGHSGAAYLPVEI
jgi:hypothetical protein